MPRKTSAHYQREYRKRLREQGLIKKEVWVHPDHTRTLAAIEKQLRLPQGAKLEYIDQTGVNSMTSIKIWTSISLFNALNDSELTAGGAATVELIEGVDPAIQVTMHDYGDLPIFLTVSGEQIIVESVLWAASEITNISDFNEAILRTHKYFPLSTISLDKMGDGKDYYHMFGSLSSASFLQHIAYEIEVLASNVIQATSAYGEYLTTHKTTQPNLQ